MWNLSSNIQDEFYVNYLGHLLLKLNYVEPLNHGSFINPTRLRFKLLVNGFERT